MVSFKHRPEQIIEKTAMETKKKSKYRSSAKHGIRPGEATKLAVIAQLGTGKTIREVAKLNGMSTARVLRFKQELGSVDTINQEVNTLKKGLSRKVWRIGDMLADSVIDHPEFIDTSSGTSSSTFFWMG
jgi:ABC-type Na+ transport system ATPase subunit NatA